MSNYTKSTNFATKDTLPSGNPLKIVRGTEIDTEFNNIATAVNSKSDSISPTFTGTVTTAALAATTISASTSVTTGVLTNAGTLALSATGANVITASTNGSERLRIDASGNVGIGTSSPVSGARFASIGGSVQLSGGTTSGAGIRIQAATGVASVTGINNDNNAFNAISFATGASEAVRIDTSGNVGVATTSPTEKLDVNGTVKATLFSGSGASLTNLPDPPIGYGQTWQNLTSSRSFGVTYTNTTGRPIFVAVYAAGSPNDGAFKVTVDGLDLGTQGFGAIASGVSYATITFLVPPSSSYSASNVVGASMISWRELR